MAWNGKIWVPIDLLGVAYTPPTSIHDEGKSLNEIDSKVILDNLANIKGNLSIKEHFSQLEKLSNFKLHMPNRGYKLKLGVNRSKRFVRSVWKS